MVTEFRLPELGEDIESGDVISVLVSVGDVITQDQPVMEIETDKATIEVPAPVCGVVKSIHVKAGQTIKVGQLLMSIEESTDEKEKKAIEDTKVKIKEEETRNKEEKQEITEPKTKKEEPKFKPKREEREEEWIGKKQIEAEEEERKRESAENRIPKEREGEVVEFSRKPKAVVGSEAPRELAPAAPSVRRLARELGIDINEVPGSGPGGRISEDDVKNYVRYVITRGMESKPETHPIPTPTIPTLPDFTKWGEIEREPMTNVRRKTVESVGFAWMAIPHVTQHDKADVTGLEELRKSFGKKVEEAGGKLTVTSILLKVVASALKVFPKFNASVDTASNEIIYKKYYHIRVAVDTERGLLIPVIRDVDKKNIIELSVELAQVSEKARNRKLTVEEMKGGTFTISNLGSIGGTYFSPIIYWPEVAVLGISRSKVEPVFADGQFKPRLMLPLSLSYDHRVIDGADGARFLRWIAEAIEQPFRLILEG
ncbi:MAG: branched-chain alpha-keto acid dehydrogenase subunit E2 [Candidatus Dadabacteria bacterium]